MKTTKIIFILFLFTISTYAQFTISIPNTTSAYNTELNIPIKISNLGRRNIRNFSFDILFDNNVIEAVGLIKEKTLCEVWTWNIKANSISGGFRISGSTWWTPINKDGILLFLKFKVIAKEGATGIKFSKITINNRTPEINIKNGSFLVYVEKMIEFKKSGAGSGEILVNNISYSLPSTIKMLQGKTYVIKAVPHISSDFNAWKGDISSNSGTYSLFVKNQKEIISDFQLKTFNVGVIVEPEGFGTVNGTGIYNYGSQVNLEANPSNGKKFEGWIVDNVVVSEENTYKFEANKDIVVKAKFAPYMFNIFAESNPKDVGVINGNGIYAENEKVNISAVSNNSQWVFNNWTENGIFISSDSVLNITVQENRNLVANFSLVTAVDEEIISSQFFISAPYPNPFNPRTTFKFGLNNNSVVKLYITDVTGRIVSKIIDNEHKNKGIHEFMFNADRLSSGVYFYFYEIQDLRTKKTEIRSGKIILMK